MCDTFARDSSSGLYCMTVKYLEVFSAPLNVLEEVPPLGLVPGQRAQELIVRAVDHVLEHHGAVRDVQVPDGLVALRETQQLLDFATIIRNPDQLNLKNRPVGSQRRTMTRVRLCRSRSPPWWGCGTWRDRGRGPSRRRTGSGSPSTTC